jgi:hypothetical protein
MGFEPLRESGKLLIIFGVVFIAVGGLLAWGGKLPARLGRLPGDIIIRRENFTVYFPLATSLLLSVVLSLLFGLLGRR